MISPEVMVVGRATYSRLVAMAYGIVDEPTAMERLAGFDVIVSDALPADGVMMVPRPTVAMQLTKRQFLLKEGAR